MARMLTQGTGLIKPVTAQPDPGSPEGMVNQQAAVMRKQIQEEFQAEWSSLRERTTNARISPTKTKYYADELHKKYRLKMANFNQGISQKLANLALSRKLKEKPADPLAEFGKLDIHRNRIEARIKDFRVTQAKKGWWDKGIGTTGLEGTTLEVYDPTIVGRDKRGEYTGDWRKARLEEVQEYGALTREQKRVTAAQRPYMSGIMRTAVSSPRMGGAIADQARVYIERKTERPQQDLSTMSDEELRQIAEGR